MKLSFTVVAAVAVVGCADQALLTVAVAAVQVRSRR